MKAHLLSIIIPVYNEESHIEEVLAKIKAAKLPVNVDREIIIIDDGSSDRTPYILKNFIGDKNIIVYSSASNSGKGMAIRIGITKARGDIILIQDADLEYNPDEYTKLLAPILLGQAKVVYGSRFKGHIIGMRFAYRLANSILTLMANLLFGAKITDEATCYKVFLAEVLKNIELNCRRFDFCPEITAKLLKSGYKIHEVPISYRSRSVEEGKKISLKDGFSAAWTLIKYRFAN
ncbi:glycosyltransferase family 2 protein [Candidatus Saganbacteria bacterium]|nr:glycosyltransferase family 2 protein [Candidatus Saganbacteria bacterium]